MKKKTRKKTSRVKQRTGPAPRNKPKKDLSFPELLLSLSRGGVANFQSVYDMFQQAEREEQAAKKPPPHQRNGSKAGTTKRGAKARPVRKSAS